VEYGPGREHHAALHRPERHPLRELRSAVPADDGARHPPARRSGRRQRLHLRRAFEPALPAGCGWKPYGTGAGGANTLALSSSTPPGLGLAIELHATGAVGTAPGVLAIGFGPISFPLHGGTLLVDPANLLLLQLAFDPTGSFSLQGTLPGDPLLEGVSAWLQAVATNQPAPWTTRFSNGLQLTLCAP
jgi:hypothetical protein